jgi:lipid-A-disaccharide synthase
MEPTAPRAEPSPRAAVRGEVARALGQLALLPLRAVDFALRRSALTAELDDLLRAPAPAATAPECPELPVRPARIFVSCAEASGELHARNLVRSIQVELERRGAPQPEFSGLGSSALADQGVRTLADPVSRAVMGLHGIRSALPFYLELLERCAACFQRERPDVVALVDSPALHVPLGHIARRYGRPVLHFVTPQHWGWAPWRTAGYARAVDRALTILPFEPAWFARRGVPVAHVGHPLLDQLLGVPRTQAREAALVAVLPGSRARVIDLNLPWMLAALGRLRERAPELRAVVLQSQREHRERVARHIDAAGATTWARHDEGQLHAVLARSSAALAVSGTVLLDLLHHRLPCVCIYRVRSRRELLMYRHALCTPYFASINLLAGHAVVPEHCFRGAGPIAEVARELERLVFDPQTRRDIRRGLDVAAERLGSPGACRLAALHALELAAREAP